MIALQVPTRIVNPADMEEIYMGSLRPTFDDSEDKSWISVTKTFTLPVGPDGVCKVPLGTGNMRHLQLDLDRSVGVKLQRFTMNLPLEGVSKFCSSTKSCSCAFEPIFENEKDGVLAGHMNPMFDKLSFYHDWSNADRGVALHNWGGTYDEKKWVENSVELEFDDAADIGDITIVLTKRLLQDHCFSISD